LRFDDGVIGLCPIVLQAALDDFKAA